MKNGTDIANEAIRKLENDWRTAHSAWCDWFGNTDFGVPLEELDGLYWIKSEAHDRVCDGCPNKKKGE